MDTFVDSAWYFLRYVDPHSDSAVRSARRRLPGSRRPVHRRHRPRHRAHLYSRFFVKVMNEMGLVGFREPFASVFHQGWVQMGGVKMSKSKGNVEGPTARGHARRRRRAPLHPLPGPRRPGHGVDAFGRRGSPASCGACGGSSRGHCERLTGRSQRHAAGPQGTRDDREGDRRHRRRQSYNTASRRSWSSSTSCRATPPIRLAVRRGDGRLLIQPYAPHRRGAVGRARARAALWEASWPEADPAMLERETFELVDQVNGRVRDRIEAAAALSDDELVGWPRVGEGAGALWTARTSARRSSSAQARELRRLNRHREDTDT